MIVMHPSVSGCTTSGLVHVGHKRGKEVRRGGREEQAWECPTVKFRACGRVRLESPQSDLSVTELCDNTNILSSFWTRMQAGPQGCRHEKGNTGMRTSVFVFTLRYLAFILHLWQMSVSIDLFSV